MKILNLKAEDFWFPPARLNVRRNSDELLANSFNKVIHSANSPYLNGWAVHVPVERRVFIYFMLSHVSFIAEVHLFCFGVKVKER